MEMVFAVTPGKVTGVQQDVLDLSELGHVTNERASDVEWSDVTQVWYAVIREKFRRGDGPHFFVSKSRLACIEWEVGYLNCEISQ